MAYVSTIINESPVFAFTAAEDFETGTLAVTISDDGAAKATAGAAAAGIILPSESDIKAGDDVTVQIKDICRWTTGAAVAAGDLLTADDDGKAVTAESGAYILARALETASDADTMVQVQIIHAGYAS